MKVEKIPEREKYNTYWRLHLPMLLSTIKKGFSQKNINTNNTSAVVKIVKIVYTNLLM